MRRSLRALMLSTAILAGGLCGLNASRAAVAPADGKTAVPVTAVVLFSSGVGYFQHAGSVDGDAVTTLQFSAKQINDVLKSLVLQDMGGSVSAVTYASQDPLGKTLKSFQVDVTSNPSLDQLLNQLRGARVSLSLPSEQISGTILGVEKRTKPAGSNKTYDVPVLNIVTDAGIRSLELPDVRDVRLDDPVLQAELSKALAALAASRDQDKKPVTIHFSGKGQRQVLIGYVVETPVWKTSYRLVLGDKDAKLQGWAIVENQTDNDWNDVQLGLVSGRPISFIEDLYQPLYVTRPTVQPELYSGLLPPKYPAGMAGEGRREALSQMQSDRTATGAAAPAMPMTLNPTESVAAAASAAQIGELFQYTVGNVSLPRQSSAMIPIVTDSIQAQRLSIYNPSVLPRNPLNGARLKNTTGKHLLGGPLTVFDAGSYAGDAQIDNLPPEQSRLISYGIDLQMLVDTTSAGRTDETLTAKIVNGVLQVSHQYIATTVYDSQNKSDHDKTLIIEHAFQPDWKLLDTPEPVEKTDSLYRFQESVAAGKSAKLTVKEQRVQDEGFAILGGDVDAIVAFTRNGAIPQAVKDALQKAADMKRSLADAQRSLQANKDKQQAIVDDQKRINETLRTIGQNTALYSRLMEKLNAQETDLEKLRGESDDLTRKANEQQKQLEDYLANLNIG
ncbi:MAG: hypothetical protein ABR964_12145 [Tepidisphaeraceae bacterium]